MATREEWLQRCDSLKAMYGIKDDHALGKYLGLSKASFHQFRSGLIDELSPLTRLIILDKLGYAWATEAIGELLPKKQREQLKKSIENQAQYIIVQNSMANYSDDEPATHAVVDAEPSKSNSTKEKPSRKDTA